MSRLIDADALSRIVKLAWETSDSEDFEKSVFIAIATAPTIERKKGKWINEGIYGEGHNERAIRCSNCDWHYIGYLDDYKFCPNCGADIRG